MDIISKLNAARDSHKEASMLRFATYADLAAVFDLVQASTVFDLQKSMFTRTYVDQLNQERH